MGQWQVRGADRESGHDVGQIYDARNRDEAVKSAVRDGMLVETIDELLVDDPPPTSEPVLTLNAAIRREEATAHRAVATKPLDYGNESFERAAGGGPAPSYAGLLIAGRTLRVMAIIYYALGGLLLCVEAWSMINAPSGWMSLSSMIGSLIMPISLTMIGAVLHGIGSGCFALRDIARNSFR